MDLEAAEVARRTFAISKDLADTALKRFSEQAGCEVLFASRLTRGVRTNAVVGELPPHEAIDRLLANTGLVAVHDPKTGAFSVRRETREEIRARHEKERGAPPRSSAADQSPHPTSMKKTKPLARLTAMFALLISPAIHAADNTGTITGRVFNPVSNEYIRNAEVRVQGTNQVTYTESDGSFRIPNVGVGPTSVTVTYTGYQTAVEEINVTGGETAPRQIELVSTQSVRSDGSVVALGTFTVSAEREGNAKAIMEQRRNMNVTTSVASDVFGDVTDGDVGEFLKFLPGVDLDYQESATRGPRLGGMDPQYVGFTMDGVGLASADALRTGNDDRATSFDAMSITSVESIEISRTTSPDMDANSPAGTINLKTRRAFDRKGRLFSYNVGLSMNSEEFHLRKEYGPGSEKEYKALPNYKFDYSDVFLDGRLGIVASASRSDSYREQWQTNSTHSKSATDPRPVVVTAFTAKDGPVRLMKDVYSFTADFKATDRLVLSNTFIYNNADGNWRNRAFTFRAASNNTNATTGRNTVGGDGLTEVISTTSAPNAGNLAWAQSNAAKRTITRTLISKFEYKLDSIVIDGVVSYSGSFNDYEALERNFTRTEGATSINSTFVATRSDVGNNEWSIQQLSGPDWFDLSNWRNPTITNEGRYTQTEIYTGALNFQWTTPLRRFPTSIKFGGKVNHEERNTLNETPWRTWSYIGPGGNVVTGYDANGVPIISPVGSWAGFRDPHVWDMGSSKIATLYDLNGNLRTDGLPRVDGYRVANLFHSNPEQFVHIGTPANYLSAFVTGLRDIEQSVSASYAMADIRLSRKLQLRGGLRWEKTESTAVEFDPKTNAEMGAAGFPVGTDGRATTFDGVNFQYFSNPRIERSNEYDDFFPMIGLKYNLFDDVEIQAGYNQSISRPPVSTLTGTWTVNDEALLITSPNPNLEPEYSKNFAARVAYYFNPAGQLSVSIAQNTIRNARETRRGTAEEFGIDDPDFAGYEFQAPFNVDNPIRHRNFEIAYSQTLPFRSEWLRGITVNGSYSRSYASQRRGNLTPHRFASSVGYRFRKFSTRVGVVWRDDTDLGSTTADIGRYRRHDTLVDLSAEYRINRWASVYVQGRNIFNVGQTLVDTPPGLVQGESPIASQYQLYGTLWSFGVKGRF